MQRALMWSNLYGRQAVQRTLDSGINFSSITYLASDVPIIHNGGKVYYRKNKEKGRKYIDNTYNYIPPLHTWHQMSLSYTIYNWTYFDISKLSLYYRDKMSNLKVLLNLGFKEHSVLLNNQGDRLAPFSHSRFYLKDNFSFFKKLLFSLNREATVVGR